MANAMRVRACLVGGLLVAATAYPALLDPRQDGYPLSTYPMFSHDRGPRSQVASALVRDAAGQDRPLPPRLIANSEAMQAVHTLNRALRGGRQSARVLCRAIAERVASEGGPALLHAREVLLVHETVTSIAYLAGRTGAEQRRTRARCPVPGREPGR